MVQFQTVKPGTTLYVFFDSFASATGASITLSGLAVTDIEIYKDGGTTQRASDNGYTLLDTDGIDFDGLTGIHGFSINLADNSDAGFYAAGSRYYVVVSSVTVDSQTVSFVAARFVIGYPSAVLDTTIASLSSQTSFTLTAGPAEDDALNGMWLMVHDVASAVQAAYAVVSDYTGASKTVTLAAAPAYTIAATDNVSVMGLAPLQPTVMGRTLDVSAGGEAGVDWANVGSPTTTLNLSGTTVKTATDVETDTQDIQSRLPAALVGGRMDANMGAISADATAADNAESFFDGTGYAGTNNVIPTVTTVTNQVTANVTQISGDTTAADNLEAAADGTGFNLGAGQIVAASVTGAVGSVTAQVTANMTAISGDTTAADNAESFFDGTGYAGTNNVIPTVTTLTGHTPQTGDSFARLGAPAGASVSADIAAIEAQTDDVGAAGAGLTAIPWNAAWDAEVQSEVADALAVYDPPTQAEVVTAISDALTVTTIPELAQAQPSATPTIATAIMLLYMTLRNQETQSSTEQTIRNDAGTVIAKAAVSDAGGTFTKGKLSSGP